MRHSSSFRDPSGFIFFDKGIIKRQISKSYKENYGLLMSSGLYQKLVDEKLLVPHKEIKKSIIQPIQIPFISYPYEWTFGELKDAALTTLKIQKNAIDFGMSLKDASAFNIQFLDGMPILIDTLSFEKLDFSKPWVAYKQFCQHFLSPLVLFCYLDPRLVKLMQTDVNGIAVDLAGKLLPLSAKIRPLIFIHIFLHGRNMNNSNKLKMNSRYSKKKLVQLIQSLEDLIKSLDFKAQKSRWSNYYEDFSIKNYGDKNLVKKKEIVSKYLKILKPKIVWDIGANTGKFSKIGSDQGAMTIAMDNDVLAVEELYKSTKKEKRKNILPLVIDITNPTPAIGWENKERESLYQRPNPDTIMALAVIHHLAIGNNLPISAIAELFSKLTKSLIIEFVPKTDYQVKTLLISREDIFMDYNEDAFEKEFSFFFKIKKSEKISKSGRKIYLMTK